jgi:hypothetical protein
MSNTSQTNQAHARRFNGAIRFVLTVMIATLLGPFIGAILMMLGRIGLDLARWEFDPADIRGVIVIFMMGAYAVGGVIAFAAGVLVALGALWREATFAMVVVAIVLANLGCYLLVQPMVSPMLRSSPNRPSCRKGALLISGPVKSAASAVPARAAQLPAHNTMRVLERIFHPPFRHYCAAEFGFSPSGGQRSIRSPTELTSAR